MRSKDFVESRFDYFDENDKTSEKNEIISRTREGLILMFHNLPHFPILVIVHGSYYSGTYANFISIFLNSNWTKAFVLKFTILYSMSRSFIIALLLFTYSVVKVTLKTCADFKSMLLQFCKHRLKYKPFPI